jgi:hypothetical protein
VTDAARRRGLGLPTGAALASLVACSESELAVRVVLPEDTTDLEAADNASLVLDPGGTVLTEAIDGLDFSLAVALEPDTKLRTLALYLAEETTLLAWGRTPRFVTAGPAVGLSLFAGRPGRLSTFPRIVENPDPDALAGALLGRGMLVLESDGDAFVLNEYVLDVEAVAPLDDPPDAADAHLVPLPDGSIVRLDLGPSPSAHRFDPEADTWAELSFEGTGLGERTGAAVVSVMDDTAARALVLGGSTGTGVAAIDLDANRVRVDPASLPDLDVPRPGAHAIPIGGDDDALADVLVFGAVGTDDPAAWHLGPERGLGPAGPWIGGRCTPIDDARLICAGGRRDDVPTADALEVRPGAGEATLHVDALTVPIGDPAWLGDGSAVYAQGAGALVRVERESLAAAMVEGTFPRAAGGHFVTLGTGATFATGGVDGDGDPLARWQVFIPALE